MTPRSEATYSAVCPTCDTGVRTDDANETIAFFRRHRRVTDHDIEIEHAAGDITVASGDIDILPIVRKLQSTYDPGVPVGIVAAVMSDHGWSTEETMDRIRERRMAGTLYEPTDDHIRALYDSK